MKRLRWWQKPKKRSDNTDLERYFAALRKQAPRDSFDEVKHWLIHAEQRASARQHKEYSFEIMKSFFLYYRTRLTVFCLLLAVTVISCTTPVEQEETIGHAISGVIDSEMATSATLKLGALEWLKPNQLDLGVVEKEVALAKTGSAAGTLRRRSPANHRFVIALPETGESQAHNWANDIRQIAGIQNVEVQPLHVTSAKKMYEVVLQSFKNGEEDQIFKPNQEQLNKAMSYYLRALKMSEVEVEEIRDAHGNYQLMLNPPEDMDNASMVTLKKFLGEVSAGTIQRRSTEETAIFLKQKIEELEAEMATNGDERKLAKVEKHLENLRAKLKELKQAEK